MENSKIEKESNGNTAPFISKLMEILDVYSLLFRIIASAI